MKVLFKIVLSLTVLLSGGHMFMPAKAQGKKAHTVTAEQHTKSGLNIDAHQLSLHFKYAPPSKKENEKIFVTERAGFDEDDETSQDDDDHAGLNMQFAAMGYHAPRDYCCYIKAATFAPQHFAFTSSYRCALYQVYRI